MTKPSSRWARAGSACPPYPDPRRRRRRQGEQGSRGQDQGGDRASEKGEDFDKVAKEVTEDPSGKANGGDLGYFTKEQMVPEFSDAAFKLDKGQISEPVKTQFGWHVIKVEDKRVKPLPTFDEVKPQIEQYRDAQGAGRPGHQAARQRQDREDVQDRATGGSSARARAGQEVEPIVLSNECVMPGLVPGIVVLHDIAHVHRDLPPRPAPGAGHAGDRRRAARHRGSRHPLRRPHRRAAGAVRPRHHRGRRVHPIEVPVGAGRMVPRTN